MSDIFRIDTGDNIKLTGGSQHEGVCINVDTRDVRTRTELESGAQNAGGNDSTPDGGGISSVYVTGCLMGSGTESLPISVIIDPTGGISCGPNGLLVTNLVVVTGVTATSIVVSGCLSGSGTPSNPVVVSLNPTGGIQCTAGGLAIQFPGTTGVNVTSCLSGVGTSASPLTIMFNPTGKIHCTAAGIALQEVYLTQAVTSGCIGGIGTAGSPIVLTINPTGGLQCTAGGLALSTLVSATVPTGCLTGSGTVASPLSILLNPTGGLQCTAGGLAVNLAALSSTGTVCYAFSYETGTAPTSPTMPTTPLTSLSSGNVQVEVYDNVIRFWAYNPSGFVLDKEFTGGGSSSSSSGYLTAEIDVASRATGGVGSIASPWTGWDTAITWAEFTRYRFRSGFYSYATSPNYLKYGIELIGEPGSYLVHTGSGNAFTMDAGSGVGGLWIQNVRVDNLTISGVSTQLTGLMNVSNGATTVSGVGTSFLSQVAVNDAITFAYGQADARSYIVTAVNSNTNLTIDRAATLAESSSQAKVTKTQNGFYLRGVRNGVFDRLSVKNVAKAAIWTEACVTNSLRMFRCTYHEPAQYTHFQCRPQYGIVTAGRGADWSTTWTIEEPVIEGIQTYGIWFKNDSYGNTVINGTSEGNPGIGIQIDSTNNTFINIDVEANTGNDIVVNGYFNVFENIFSNGTVTFTVSGSRNVVTGGIYNNLTINSNAYLNDLTNCHQITTLSDSGNNTLYMVKVPGSDSRSMIGCPLPIITSITAGGAMATNSAVANLFTVNMSTDCTLSAPTNALNGAEITYRFDNNSGSSKNITWNSVYQSVGSNVLPTSVLTGTSVYVTFRYSSFWTKWQCIYTSTVAGGSSSSVQFNSSGFLNGSSNFTWDNTNATLNVTGTITTKNVTTVAYAIVDGTGVDINPNNGSVQLWTLGGSRTPTANFFNPGQAVTLMIDDGSGNSINWSNLNPTWIDGAAPSLPTSGYGLVELWKVGSTIFGASLASGVASGGGTPASPTNSVQFNNAGSFGGSSNLTWDGSTLSVTGNVTSKNYARLVYTISDGTGVDINPANGGIQLWTLGASRTPTASSFAQGQGVTLMIDDGSGYTVDWNSINVNWIGGSAPTLATSGYTPIELWKVGSTVYGVGIAASGSAGTPASPTNSIQFNNGGVFGGSSNLTWDGNCVMISGVTTSGAPILNVAQKWNGATSTAYSGVIFNFIDPSSAASTSKLLDLQVGGSSKFSVRKDSAIMIGAGGSYISPGAGTSITLSAFDQQINLGGAISIKSAAELSLSANATLNWTNLVNNPNFNVDLTLTRDAADILAQRRATNAQAFRVYNTYTSTGVYERGTFDWAGSPGVLQIGTQHAGATARGLQLITSGTPRIDIAAGGAIQFYSAYTFPSTNGSSGQVLTTNGAGTLTWGNVSGAASSADYFIDETDEGNSGTSMTINFGSKANHKVTLTGHCTFTFTAPASARETKIRFVQGGTGGYAITLPSGTLGTTPVLPTGVGSQSIVTLFYDRDGNWHV